jgi:small GTP-binding protein
LYNKLRTFPPEICKLQKLTRLTLWNNQLTAFPKALLDLNLEIKWGWGYKKGIYIKDNPFQTPPVEIVKQGRQAIIDYYAALGAERIQEVPSIVPVSIVSSKPTVQVANDKTRSLNESKLILMGEGAAGKTSLMKRLLGLAFDPQESQMHGINIQGFSLNDSQQQRIKLHCWDFGGQQIMHATHQFFLSKRCLYLLVLDSRRETQVEYWLKHIQTFGDHAPVIIVLNKIDQNPHFNLSQRQLKQRYPNIKDIQRVSCATEAGIKELKQCIQKTLPAIELLYTPFPATWFAVKNAIEEQAQQRDFASYEQYVAICEANGIKKDSEQTTLINFLHDLGLINHFQDPWLRETNVINPQWITQAVYTLLNAPQLAHYGKLHRNDLKTLLDQTTYPERKHDYILQLMQKFELCYALNKQEYLLPDLLSSEEPVFEFKQQTALHFILQYDFLPKSIFTRFMIKMHRDIEDSLYWRNGMVLKDRGSDTRALIEVNHEDKFLSLQLTGTQKREYLFVLRFVLADIHSSFKQFKVTEKIGLPDNPEISVDYQYLENLVKSGQNVYIPPENPSQSYDISEILAVFAISQANSETALREILQEIKIQGAQPAKEDIVKIRPSLLGVTLDVNALYRYWRDR